MPLLGIALTSCLFLTGCPNSSPIETTPTKAPPKSSQYRALQVGHAAGTVYDTLASNYKMISGIGNEDPAHFKMIVIDGAHTTPEQLYNNPGPANFMRRGKAVVILNSTPSLIKKGLKGVIWAHVGHVDSVDSPAVAFFKVPGKNGGPAMEVEVSFPDLLAEDASGCSLSPAPCPVTVVPPSASELAAEAEVWLNKFQQKFAPVDGRAYAARSNGNIGSPATSKGQTVFTYDLVQPLMFIAESATQDLPRTIDDVKWLWCTEDRLETCKEDVEVKISTKVKATFESKLSVLLKPINNGTAYQHKLILRQYAMASPSPLWNRPYYLNYPVILHHDLVFVGGTSLGFNAAVRLRAHPSAQYPMVVTESSPANANNTETVKTYRNQTETVGASVTGGYSKGATGTVSASWSNSWTWGHSKSVNIKDWQVESTGDPKIEYLYKATGGTPNTYHNLTTRTFPDGMMPPVLGAKNLNALQRGNMVAESETAWKTSTNNGPVGPVVETMHSSVEFIQGEAYTFPLEVGILVRAGFGATHSYTYNQDIKVNFSDPGLQPPAKAPWTLKFSPWPQTVGTEAKVTGMLAISNASDNPGTINLSYVVQPKSPLLTLPSTQVCPGNKTTFVPGNNVVNNGQPPLTIKIPDGKTSVSFPVTFQTFNTNNYNVQVVAWQPKATIDDKAVINPQSAWCLTVPNTTK